jgi:sugar lactone lactonase YvrE
MSRGLSFCFPWSLVMFGGSLLAACDAGSAVSPDLSIPEMGSGVDMAPPGSDASPFTPTTLTFIAGGLGGTGSADHAGAAARFGSVYGTVLDGAGSLYVSDSDRQRIRKVILGTGEVTTLAGSLDDVGSDDGTGAAARFNFPAGIASDGAFLYVADSGSHTIRKIDAQGAVITLAGSAGEAGSQNGTGVGARFQNPKGIAFGLDPNGTPTLYLADTTNETIRTVEIATGVVATLTGVAGERGANDKIAPGDPEAHFNSPEGLAVADATTLYVADSGNNTIRKVDLATREVTTIAGKVCAEPCFEPLSSRDGTGDSARFATPTGLAFDGEGTLFVSDNRTHVVRKVVVASGPDFGVVTTLVGSANRVGSDDGTGPAARFHAPNGISHDVNGNLYVADGANGTLRAVATGTGAVTTLSGTAAQLGSNDGTGTDVRFDGPNGVVSDGAGILYVSDTGNHTIRKVVLATGDVSLLAGVVGDFGSDDTSGFDAPPARFHNPQGLAMDKAGHLYVADTNNNAIRQLDVVTGEVVTVAGGFDGVVGGGSSRDGTGADARFSGPEAVAVDGAGDLFVADTENHTIRKLVLANRVVTTWAGTAPLKGSKDGTGSAARFYFPRGLACDGPNLYVADHSNDTIRKVVIATKEVSTLAGMADGHHGYVDEIGTQARFSGPRSIAYDGAGSVYVADTNNHVIRKVELASLAVSTVAGLAGSAGVFPGPLPAGLNSPLVIAVVPSVGAAILDENAVLFLH